MLLLIVPIEVIVDWKGLFRTLLLEKIDPDVVVGRDV